MKRIAFLKRLLHKTLKGKPGHHPTCTTAPGYHPAFSEYEPPPTVKNIPYAKIIELLIESGWQYQIHRDINGKRFWKIVSN